MQPPSDPVSQPVHTPWWGRIETLWLMAPALCAFLYTLCLPLVPNDFWYQLRAGWWIATHRALPTQNLFAWGVPLDKPYFYQSWIGELVLYEVTRHGLAWALVFRSVCVSASIGLVTASALNRARCLGLSAATAARVAAGGATLAFLICSNNLDVRTQTLSMLLFAVWLFLLEGWSRGSGFARRVVPCLCPLLLVLWVNTHGAFVVALVYIGCLGLGELITKRSWRLLAIGMACGAGAFLNPRGPGIFSYLARFRDPAFTGQIYIQEWQSPSLGEWHNTLFLLAPIPLLIGLAASRRKWSKGLIGGLFAGEWLVGAVLYYLGLQEMRAMLWFALWLGLAGTSLGGTMLTKAGEADAVVAPVPRPVQFANACLLFCLLAAPMPLLPWFKPNLPWPPAFTARFAPTPRGGDWGFDGDPELILEDSTPVAASAFLRKSPPQGRLWNEMVYGSYLTWALYPRVPPNSDPRVELFSDDFWREYLEVGRGGPGIPEKLERQGVTDALLDAEQQPGLMKRLRSDRNWREVFHAGKTHLFRRKKFSQESLVAKPLLHRKTATENKKVLP